MRPVTTGRDFGTEEKGQEKWETIYVEFSRKEAINK